VNRRELALIAETRAALADGTARYRRVAARITVSEIAAACGASRAAVSMWERQDPETGKPVRVPGTVHALAYGRALAAAERRAALPAGDTPLTLLD
jgi:transcriptional regulator with XRE-family HTH domain